MHCDRRQQCVTLPLQVTYTNGMETDGGGGNTRVRYLVEGGISLTTGAATAKQMDVQTNGRK